MMVAWQKLALVACLPVTPQDSSLHHFLSQSVTMYSARAVTLVISDTFIVHVTYLLTLRVLSSFKRINIH